MKKQLMALFLASILLLIGCSSRSAIPALEDIPSYTQAQLEEALSGLSNEEMHAAWGEPDGFLSGFWGDIWRFDEASDERVILYYDAEGKVEDIVIRKE